MWRDLRISTLHLSSLPYMSVRSSSPCPTCRFISHKNWKLFNVSWVTVSTWTNSINKEEQRLQSKLIDRDTLLLAPVATILYTQKQPHKWMSSCMTRLEFITRLPLGNISYQRSMTEYMWRLCEEHKTWTPEQWKHYYGLMSQFQYSSNNRMDLCLEKPKDALKPQYLLPTVRYAWGLIMAWTGICRIDYYWNWLLYNHVKQSKWDLMSQYIKINKLF